VTVIGRGAVAPGAAVAESTAVAQPTIRDVAREAGVGIGTVSRVLSGGALVAEETRRRVLETIERLGYRPNASARALARGRAPSHTVEVIVPLLTRYYYFEILSGVVAALADTDYCLNIRVLERPADRTHAFAEADRRGHPDGLLVLRVPPTDELVARLARARVPAVLVDAAHPELPGVGVDHRANGAAIVGHLLSLGHRRIALVDRADDPFDAHVLAARRQGYREALTGEGVMPRPGYEQAATWSAEGAAAALDALLSLPEPPTAVVSGGDTQAIGMLERARQRGLSVPGDLSVCGYGDVEPARYVGLTTVRVPLRELGERGTGMLLAALDGAEVTPSQQVFACEVVARATCGAPGPGR
jgi:DNA-binding LacI/PurR family transcriptional regulator